MAFKLRWLLVVPCAGDSPELRGPRLRDDPVVWLALRGCTFSWGLWGIGIGLSFCLFCLFVCYLAREGHKRTSVSLARYLTPWSERVACLWALGCLHCGMGIRCVQWSASPPQNSLIPKSLSRAWGSMLKSGAKADLTLMSRAACLLAPQSLQGLTGTPLVAGSPIRHENAVQGSAVEVQTYQPPWKALSEFALQSDLDQPAFQQLVRPCAHCTVGVGWRGLRSLRTSVLGTDLVMRKPSGPATSLLTLTRFQCVSHRVPISLCGWGPGIPVFRVYSADGLSAGNTPGL